MTLSLLSLTCGIITLKMTNNCEVQNDDVAEEVVVPTEARVCESKSHGFHGLCVSNHNCALVCRNEGFSGGRCRGFRRRCFCTKAC